MGAYSARVYRCEPNLPTRASLVPLGTSDDRLSALSIGLDRLGDNGTSPLWDLL
jgi:hypothetical protein